jgi:DNA-binding response OmpR family regulator
MKSISISIITESGEIVQDVRANFPEAEVFNYKSFESVKIDNSVCLLVDADLFITPDSAQFFLSKLRKKIHDIPVLLIIKVNKIEEIKFDWFFNDFIVYPFRKWELQARSKKFFENRPTDNDTILIGKLKINLKEYSVYMIDEKLELTYKEFELLRLFFENRGVVFSRKDLLSRIWGLEYIGGTRTVDVHIRRLRGKLGDEFNSVIETVRNVGYRCKEDI